MCEKMCGDGGVLAEASLWLCWPLLLEVNDILSIASL